MAGNGPLWTLPREAKSCISMCGWVGAQMDADAFRQALAAAAPNADELAQVGLSPSDANVLISSFQLDARFEVAPNAIPNGALCELFSRFNPSRVEIGVVRLAPEPTETAEGWRLGAVDADDLILDRRSGEIIVAEFGTNGHVLWRCASNGERFLAALAIAAPYLASCMTLSANGTNASDVLRACSISAGGNDFFDFYAMLLGAE